MLRIFERGHVMEDCMVGGCGTRVLTCAPARPTASSSVSRWPMAACRVVDASFVAGPDGFCLSRAWENKCLGNKSWSDLEKKPDAISKLPSTRRKWRCIQAYLELARAPGDLHGGQRRHDGDLH